MASTTVIKTLKVEVRADGVLQLAGGLDKLKDSANNVAGATDRAKKGVAGVANGTKNFSKQAQGMGGLVRAYATVAAHVFALTAAFSLLKTSADLSAMEESAKNLGATTGINYAGVARSLKELSAGALTFAESMRTANLASSAGISQGGLERLTSIGVKAATVLGRNVPDAVNRLVQAVVKGEPELVDEFGIILRLTTASEKYGESIGKAAKDLSTFEKSQAILNQVLEQGEDKYANITAAAKPYQKLSAEFLDIGQKILSFLAGPITGIVSFLADNTALITIAIIALSSSIIKLAIPAIGDLGDAFQAKLANRIADSTEQISKLKKKGEELQKSLKPNDAAKFKKQAEQDLAKTLKEDPALSKKIGKTRTSAVRKALEAGASDADLAKAANTSMKKYIAQLRKQTKQAIESGAKTVNLRGQQIGVSQAKALIANADSFNAKISNGIADGAKNGVQRLAIGVEALSARFKATTTRMGLELTKGLQAGLANTSFADLRKNLGGVLKSGTITSKFAVALGGVAAVGKTAVSAFSKLLPLGATLLIAFQGFKFIATSLGVLTPSYDRFNKALGEANTLLEEQIDIQKAIVKARKSDSKSATLAGQIKFIDALNNSFGTIETAADKLGDAATELGKLSTFDRLLAFITSGGSTPEAGVNDGLNSLAESIKLATGTDIREDESLIKARARVSNLETSRDNLPAIGSDSFGAGNAASQRANRNATLAILNKQLIEARENVGVVINQVTDLAKAPLAKLQGNFKAIAESSTNIGSNIAAASLAAASFSSSAGALRDVNIGLSALNNLTLEDTTTTDGTLNRAAAVESFIGSLSASAKRYFGILETSKDFEGDLLKIKKEQGRLDARVRSDVSAKFILKNKQEELKEAKKISSLESTNLGLIEKRRDIEASILSTKIRIARNELAFQAALIPTLDAGSSGKAAQQAKVNAQFRSIEALQREKAELKGIDEQIEKTAARNTVSVFKAEAISTQASAQLDIEKEKLKALGSGAVKRDEELAQSQKILAATKARGSVELLASTEVIRARKEELELLKKKEAKIEGAGDFSLTVLQEEAALKLAALETTRTALELTERIRAEEEKVFEARKNAASFSVFGSTEDNANALNLFRTAMGKETERFSRSMTNDVDRMVKGLTTTSDAFTDTLLDGFTGDSSISDSIQDAFVAGAEALKGELVSFLKEDLQKSTRQIFGEILGIDTSTPEEQTAANTKIIAESTLRQEGLMPTATDELNIANQTKTVFTGMIENVQDIFGTLWDNLGGLFGGLWDNLTNIFSNIGGLFGGGGGSDDGGIFSLLAGAAATYFGGPAAGAAAGGITSASGATSFGLGAPPSFTSTDILPQFATGGIATGPSIAGEGSLNEAVVPLPDGRTTPVNLSGSGGGPVSIVINVDVESGSSTSSGGEEGTDFQALGKLISSAVKTEILNQKRPGGLLG